MGTRLRNSCVQYFHHNPHKHTPRTHRSVLHVLDMQTMETTLTAVYSGLFGLLQCIICNLSCRTVCNVQEKDQIIHHKNIQLLSTVCNGCSAAIIVAILILFTNGEHRAEANDCQLGCELYFNHAITISVRHLRASPRWLYSISLSVSGDSPSATPRLNHSAVRVEILSRAAFKEHCSERL